ncbi:MAG TPA: VOC family protein [Candidatus Limnocylindria bacterium]|nr:VOC family protein [Candidatus Limnocylindria bacterium]
MTVIGGVTPYLIVAGAPAAIDWYERVLDAEEVSRATGGAGQVVHAELRIGSSSIFIGDEHVNYEDIHGPRRIGGSPVHLAIETDDVAGTFARGVAAGATAIRRPTSPEMPVQSAKFRDPFGHIWLITRSASG